MTARQTINSLTAAISSIIVSSCPKCSHEQNINLLRIFAAWQACCFFLGTAATANLLPAASTTVLFPDLMALINKAVQVAVQVSQRQPEPAIVCPACCLAPVRHPLHRFSPRGWAFSLPYQVPQPQVGPFLWLCLLLCQPLTGQSWQSFHLRDMCQVPSTNVNSLADQLFVVGPGFSPVLPKTCFANTKWKSCQLVRTLSGKLGQLRDQASIYAQ